MVTTTGGELYIHVIFFVFQNTVFSQKDVDYFKWRNFGTGKIWRNWRKMKNLCAKVTKIRAKSIKRLKNLLCAKLNCAKISPLKVCINA